MQEIEALRKRVAELENKIKDLEKELATFRKMTLIVYEKI